MDATKKRGRLAVGDPAPWFRCRTRARERYAFDTVAGRHVVLSFFGSAAAPHAAALLDGVRSARERFDDERVCFFGVSTDPADLERPGLDDQVPGIRFFWDFDRAVSELYGVIDADGSYRPMTYVLDPRLRVVAVIAADHPAHLSSLLALLERLPGSPAAELARPHAPVLVVPRIFEPALCRDLIAYYERTGGIDSGYMREVNGRTEGVIDYGHKRRRDREIEDETLRRACMVRIHNRLAPEIEKAFQFQATRMERYIVACYDAQEGGYFRPHRDNSTKGTAHRRFAVSLFLNAGEFEGGLLRFPEFGNALYAAPTGGAVVFGCSMLHEATPVKSGRRYMFLPFLYDEAAARIREENQKFLGPERADGKDEARGSLQPPGEAVRKI
jgi:peroxiredoxin/predicted 2-oxoglutarate/Fe(II)-dependent dioxygenase YbiX